MTDSKIMTLEQQRAAFTSRRFLATPLSGLICWAAIGVGSIFLNEFQSVMLVFIATGSIVYLAMMLSKLTGEVFFRKEKILLIDYFLAVYSWHYWCMPLPSLSFCKIIVR